MNNFDRTIAGFIGDGLYADAIDVMQVNVGLNCNQRCTHCHLEASPDRSETMRWEVMEKLAELAVELDVKLVDITGGAPEMNPHIREFIAALRKQDTAVQVRTNLTVLAGADKSGLPGFFADNRVSLVGSLPCYMEENVDAQRGAGTYRKCIDAIRALNRFGYGVNPELPLDLVYNPAGPFLPPPQKDLEADYRRELKEKYDVGFRNLFTITNMPIGRFATILRAENRLGEYMDLLAGSMNPTTLGGLMCRRQISVGWNGNIYDCDFNLALNLPVNHGAPMNIKDFDPDLISSRRIVTGDHCFGCTAGNGSSCGGAII